MWPLSTKILSPGQTGLKSVRNDRADVRVHVKYHQLYLSHPICVSIHVTPMWPRSHLTPGVNNLRRINPDRRSYLDERRNVFKVKQEIQLLRTKTAQYFSSHRNRFEFCVFEPNVKTRIPHATNNHFPKVYYWSCKFQNCFFLPSRQPLLSVHSSAL